MKFKRKILLEESPKRQKQRISLKAMEQWNKMILGKSNNNKFRRKPITRKLYIECESTGGGAANQNLRERGARNNRKNKLKSKKAPVIELLPEK